MSKGVALDIVLERVDSPPLPLHFIMKGDDQAGLILTGQYL